MTNEQLDKLVQFIGITSKSMLEISSAFPNISKEDIFNAVSGRMRYYLNDSCQPSFPTRMELTPTLPIEHTDEVLSFAVTPKNYSLHYQVQDTDVFKLSESGKDRLYNLRKDESSQKLANNNLQIAEESLRLSRESVQYAHKAYWTSIIIGGISIVIALASLWQGMH